MAQPQYPIPTALTIHINKTQFSISTSRLAILTCGLTGSGKSTLAKALSAQYPNFQRLSIDKHIYENHGTYDIDYPASRYAELQREAEGAVVGELKGFLREGKRDLVIDLSFYERRRREEFRDIIMREGGGMYEVVLVVFRGSDEVIWKRVEARRKEMEEKAKRGESVGEGMSVDRDMLKRYIEGFEWPGEDEEYILIGVE